MLSLSDVGVTVGSRQLFSNVSLRFPAGRRTALVGGNGAGKTTLLHSIIGLREPDEGTVSRPRDLSIGWLPQDVVDAVGASETVLGHVLEGATRLRELEARMRDLEQRMATAADGEQAALMASYAQDQDAFERLGGYDLESEAHRVLAGLGFAPEDAHRPTSELSGGWRVRVALARLLLSKPDLLVLDEPTNHLDLGTIEWLETVLAQWPGALLFVSHDRDFIDAVADVIVELAAGTATEYDVRSGTTAAEEGGFAAFVAQREERLTQLRAAKAQQDRVVAQQERFVERFRYKATKARQVQSRIKKLEKITRIEVPDRRELVARFGFPEPPRSGRVVAEARGLRVAYGENVVLDGVDLAVERGRKVALIGPNGAGKTTLMRAIAGELAPSAGRVELGHNVEVGMVDQHQAEAMDLSRTVLEEFRQALSLPGSPGTISDRHRSHNHRSMLGAFGFPGELADRKVGELSGGERTRLGLAKVMASPVNLVLLDEPTNHLDLASRDVLEDALQAYPGTVLLITHDRHVIRSTADAVVEVEDGRARWFDGTYEELLERPGSRAELRDASAPERQGSTGPSRHREKQREAERRNARHRATKSLRGSVLELEERLATVEAEVAELTRQLADPAVYEDTARVKELVARHGVVKDEAARLFERWEEAQLELESAEAGVDRTGSG